MSREPHRIASAGGAAGVARRLGDRVAAVVGLVLLSPVLLSLALLVRLSIGAPVLFRQQRAGWRGRAFELLKLRTMRPGDGPDEERLTRVGRVLRRWSLDELPELWNVLRGDMSLVGPRPLPLPYLSRYSAEQARRHEVTPGITGWAQVNGRNALTWEEKLKLDVWYVDHRSLGLDLRILLMTVSQVLRPQGIGHAGSPTMPEFLGTTPPARGPRP